MSIKEWFVPDITSLPDSKFNHGIKIQHFLGSTSLLVGGLTQSGDIMRSIWKASIRHLLPKYFSPRRVLLLGYGGGSNTKLINDYFPKAEITAVEIDPTMLEIGKKYFHANRYKNLLVIIKNAVDYIHEMTDGDYFDLVMVDCFDGPGIPKIMENIGLYSILKKHCRFVLINRLFWGPNRQPSLDFLKLLDQRFVTVIHNTPSNILISLV